MKKIIDAAKPAVIPQNEETDLEIVERFTAKSKLTEKDAKELARLVDLPNGGAKPFLLLHSRQQP